MTTPDSGLASQRFIDESLAQIAGHLRPRLGGRDFGAVKVLVGMSGGVDSALSAWIMRELGFQVQGAFMKNWDEDDGGEYCDALDSWLSAQRVADDLGVELLQLSFSAEYWQRVFSHFLAEHRAGRTPNPDVLCNKEIKFGAFLAYADAHSADFIVSGHYARVAGAEPTLLQGVDAGKDQSYFLHALSRAQLARALLPLGYFRKSEVRAWARAVGLSNHDRKDSTGICFVGERPMREFLQRYLPKDPGAIVDEHGRVLGEHTGLVYYTIGQRSGLGIGGVRGAAEGAWYVAQKDFARNQLVVVMGADHPLLLSTEVRCEQVHWIEAPVTSCSAKLRYRQPQQSCELSACGASACNLHFDQPQRAVCPGQYAVFYAGERCLGGGVIAQAGG